MDLAARFQPELDQVLEDLMLRVNRDHPAVGQLLQIDAVIAVLIPYLEAVVDEAFALQPVTGADLGHQVDRALLEHACSNRGLDRFTRAALDDDRFDPAEVEQLRQQQPRRASADDPDLGAHGYFSLT
jgi:hypothetical protein